MGFPSESNVGEVGAAAGSVGGGVVGGAVGPTAAGRVVSAHDYGPSVDLEMECDII